MTRLDELATVASDARTLGAASVRLSGIAYDSRTVDAGALFCCLPGEHVDGHDFAAGAVASGAVALLVERELPLDVPQLLVPSVRTALGPIASAFFTDPSRALTLIGVTGTNGKTTTTFLLEGVIRALGFIPGIIGTVETHLGDIVEPAGRTTPEAVDLQRLLARMRDGGVGTAAMEVSSEGLAFERVEGTRFACSLFTNLTQDHLDTHGTMEAYFAAKALLFRPEMSARAVVNVDDEWGRALSARMGIPLTTFGLEGDADVKCLSVRFDRTGSDARIDAAGSVLSLRVAFPGRYNVANALGVVGVALSLGWPLDTVAAGIASVSGVPGRLEPVDAGQDFTVLVDYAHTPDSLESVLLAARGFTPEGARLVVVFGCGGDRDRAKRPLMGRVAVSLADRAIITSDNPRTEDPLSIIAMIEEGARETGRAFESIPDRRGAIASAYAGARAGDVIVISGKGHESGQQFADRTIPFDDRVVAREELERL